MNWHDEKITSTGFVSQMKNDDGYEIHFYTDKREAYLAVQEVCRQFIDHKPLRNADRIRAMSDEELAEKFNQVETIGRFNGPMGKVYWHEWLRRKVTE